MMGEDVAGSRFKCQQGEKEKELYNNIHIAITKYK